MVKKLQPIAYSVCYHRFKPFTHRHRDYEPLHHTQTAYGHLPYGTAYFREEHPQQFVVPQVSALPTVNSI